MAAARNTLICVRSNTWPRNLYRLGSMTLSDGLSGMICNATAYFRHLCMIEWNLTIEVGDRPCAYFRLTNS